MAMVRVHCCEDYLRHSPPMSLESLKFSACKDPHTSEVTAAAAGASGDIKSRGKGELASVGWL